MKPLRSLCLLLTLFAEDKVLLIHRTAPTHPPRPLIEANDLETRMDAGAVGFGKYLARLMDGNGWSHPQLVALCKRCTGDKAWLHSSQIAGLRAARLKSPGPRSFVAMEYLFRNIDAYQKNDFSQERALFGNMGHLVEHAEIMRDEEGNPASLGYLVEMFTGLRPVPIDLSVMSFTDTQAETISREAGRLVRRLMAVVDMDPVIDAPTVAAKFSTNSERRAVFEALIKGSEIWQSEEVEENLNKLSKLLREVFDFQRTASELRDDFLRRMS